MIFNVWTFLFELINFLVLVYVLRRLLYRPLQEALDRRREANAKAQADAETARHEATTLQQHLNDQLADLDRQRQELMRAVRAQAQAERTATLAETDRAVQQRREAAAQQLNRERAEALQALRAELLQSALGLAERFLHEASTSTLQQQLAVRLVDELRRISDDERRRLRGELAADDTALIETATELNGEILQNIDSALKSLVGRTVIVSVQTRPELLGGVRLRLGGYVWDATLGGGLREAARTSAAGVSP